MPNNVCLDFLWGDPAKVAEAFRTASHVCKLSLRNTRVVVAAMEPRAGICSYDKASGKTTLTVPGQGVWGQKGQLTDILGATPDKVRILSYNVGGSFGMKAPIYPEYVCLAHATRELGRPVKWTDERSGSFLSDHHGRDHEITGELALSAQGEFLALRMSGYGNVGAYLSTVAPQPPSMNLVRNACGVYRIPAFEVSTKVCFTNTSPVSAYRGAGRPEANMYIERLIDVAAREMKIDRFELRRRNHVRPSEIPYKNQAQMTVDSGDFGTVFEKALEAADAKGFPKRKEESKKRGKLRGLGVGSYMEVTAPPNKEMGGIEFGGDKHITFITGSLDYGQGHASPMAQVLSSKLGVPFENIRLLQTESDKRVFGAGTGGARTAMLSGGGAVQAAELVLKSG